HFKVDGGIADLCAMPSLTIFASPSRIGCPAILSDQMNLCAADIAVKRAKQHIFEIFDARLGNLACISAALLNGEKFLCDLPKGPVEYRHIMFEPKAHISVVVKCAVARGIPVGRPQCNGFVA